MNIFTFQMNASTKIILLSIAFIFSGLIAKTQQDEDKGANIIS